MILKTITKNWGWIFAIGVLLFLLFQSNAKTERLKRNHSIELLGLYEGIERDSLKNGQELASKQAMILTERELRNLQIVTGKQ